MVTRPTKGNQSPALISRGLSGFQLGTWQRFSDDLVSNMGTCGLKGDSFRAVFFSFAAHWAYLDAFKNSDARALHAGDSDSIGQL